MADTIIDPIPPAAPADPDGDEPRPATTPAAGAAAPAADAVLRPTTLEPATDAVLRPTVNEVAPAVAPEAGPPIARRAAPAARSRAGCFAAAAFAALTVLAAAGVALYFFFWRYEPLARRHIPGDANVAFRLEGADLLLFAPVRKHLWPLLEEPSSGVGRAGSSPASKTRAARIKDATGVNPATDVREVLVASTDAASWVVLLGGSIPKGRFVAGIEQVAREEGWAGWRRAGDLLVGPDGVAVGQAEDGVVAIGTEVEIVRAALPASDEWRRLGLPQQGAVAFAITRDAWSGVGGAIGGMLPRGGAGLFRRASRATGAFTLGDAPALVMRVEPVAGETPAALASDVEKVLSDLKLVTLLLPDVVGEKSALGSARVTTTGASVEIQTNWPYDGLDRACERLARLLRSP